MVVSFGRTSSTDCHEDFLLSLNVYYFPFTAGQDSSSLSLCEEFPRLLGDSSHALRMHMASAISVLFVRHVSGNSAVPAPRDHQYKCFDNISRILVRSLTETVVVSEWR